MNARFLLETIEARGGVATVKTGSDGAAKINVAPRSLALELLPELQRFKPGLLELLAPEEANRRETLRRSNARPVATPLGAQREFDALAAFERLPERNDGLNRAAQVEAARQSIERRFLRALQLGDRSNGRTGQTRDVWAVAVAVALLDAGKSPE